MSENKKSVVNRKDRRKSWWGEQKKKEKKRDGMIPKIHYLLFISQSFLKTCSMDLSNVFCEAKSLLSHTKSNKKYVVFWIFNSCYLYNFKMLF